MCPKIQTKVIDQSLTNRTRTKFEQWKMKFSELHRLSIFAICLYFIFVLIFVCANILTCVWHLTTHRTKENSSNLNDQRRDPLLETTSPNKETKRMTIHLDNDDQDETDSETSFGDDHNGILERIGRKIDDRLHQIFTS